MEMVVPIEDATDMHLGRLVEMVMKVSGEMCAFETVSSRLESWRKRWSASRIGIIVKRE